jgi:hypothetical protein
MSPARFVVAEGLLINHSAGLRDMFDIRVYLNPPEDLRRRWKVARDCSRRGYSTDQVLQELDRRERDSEAYIRPQRHHADIVVSFIPGQSHDPAQLDAHLFLRESLPHPDLTGVTGDGADADDLTLAEHSGEQKTPDSRHHLRRPCRPAGGGDLGPYAVRQSPPHTAAGRVHHRLRPVSFRSARSHPAPAPLPPGHRQGRHRARRAQLPRASNQPSADRSLPDPVPAASP